MGNLEAIFSETFRLHHRFHHALFNSFGLYRGQHRIFFNLKETEGISQNKLAERMKITPATLSRMVQSLEKNGFIVRKTAVNDQRKTLIFLSDKGLETKKKIKEKMKKVDEKIFKNFTSDEKIILKKMLIKIQNQLTREIIFENDN